MFRTSLSLIVTLVTVLLGGGFAPAANAATGEWITSGNGPSHTGYYPKQIGSAPFVAGWFRTFPSSINQVTISSGLVFGTGTGVYNQDVRAFALRENDGADAWTFPLPDPSEVTSPSYADGRLFFRVRDNSLWSLDAASGRLRFTSSYATSYTSGPPTVADGTVYVGGGEPGRIRKFDSDTGAERPSTDPLVLQYPTVSNWGTASPAVVDGTLYACSGGIFSANDLQASAPLWSLDLRHVEPTSVQSWSDGSEPVISNGLAVVRGSDRLAVVDLATRAARWIKTGVYYSGTPAMADGKVYVVQQSAVKAFDAASGALLGTFTASGYLGGQPLLTKDLLIASNGTNTFVFDRATTTLRQTLAVGGQLSYAAGRLYVASSPWNAPATLYTFTVAAAESDPSLPPLPATPGPQSQANPNRLLPATTSPWVDMTQADNIAYFLFDSPAKIERYLISTGTWLAPISLPDNPKAFTVSSDGIYVSFAASVSKFALDGSTETVLAATPATIKTLFTLNGRLYLAREFAYDVYSIDPTTGNYLYAENYDSQRGLSLSPSTGSIYGRNLSIPGDILKTTINADGSFGQQIDSPYHGDYPTATRTFVMPGGGRVFDDSGSIYSGADLTYLGSLGAFQDIGFHGSAPVVLRADNSLVAFSGALVETGRVTLPAGHSRIAIGDGFVHAFARENGRGVRATRTFLGDLGAIEPGNEINPTNLNYTPDEIAFGGDTVHLLSKVHQSIFRWSISQRRYLATISLAEIPSSMTYDRKQDRLYLGYAGGRISKIDLAQGTSESAFAKLPATPVAMLPIDGFMFFATKATYMTWTLFTFATDGTAVATKTDADIMVAPIWSSNPRRIIYIASNDYHSLRAIEVTANGGFGAYSWGPSVYETSVSPPVAIAPTGSPLLLDNAAIYNPTALAVISELPVPLTPEDTTYPYTPRPRITDAMWRNGVLHTIRDVYAFGTESASSGVIESWNADATLGDSTLTNGQPLRIHPLSDGVLLVSLVDGRPEFTTFDAALDQTSSSPGDHPPATNPVAHPNPSRVLAPTAGPWIRAAKHAGIAYFLFDAPAKIERYDLDGDLWLPPISLPDGPREFVVGASGIYVSFGKSLSRFSLDGTIEIPLLTAAIDIRPLAEHKGRIYFANTDQVSATPRFAAADVLTGVIFSEETYSYPMGEMAFSPVVEKFFGAPPAGGRMRQITLLADGALGVQTENNYFPPETSYPVRPYILPGDEKVLLTNGGTFSTTDLLYLGGLGPNFYGSFTDVDFVGRLPVTLSGDALVVYSSGLLKAGQVSIAPGALRVFSTDDEIVSFRPGVNRGVAATRTSLTAFLPPRVDPSTLAYVPTAFALGGDTVYLVSSPHRAVFRWSISQGKYLASIPLLATPNQIAYSPAQNRLYLAYSDGQVGRIDLSFGTVESPFATVTRKPAAIFPAGDFVFLSADDLLYSNDSSVYLYAADGTLLFTSNPSLSVRFPVWSDALRSVLFINGLNYELHSWALSETGRFTGSPLLWPSLNGPIFPSPDGTRIIFANGAVFSGPNLTRIGDLPVPTPPYMPGYSNRPAVVDCAWLGGTLHTLRGNYPPGVYAADGGVIEAWGGIL